MLQSNKVTLWSFLDSLQKDAEIKFLAHCSVFVYQFDCPSFIGTIWQASFLAEQILRVSKIQILFISLIY